MREYILIVVGPLLNYVTPKEGGGVGFIGTRCDIEVRGNRAIVT